MCVCTNRYKQARDTAGRGTSCIMGRKKKKGTLYFVVLFFFAATLYNPPADTGRHRRTIYAEHLITTHSIMSGFVSVCMVEMGGLSHGALGGGRSLPGCVEMIEKRAGEVTIRVGRGMKPRMHKAVMSRPLASGMFDKLGEYSRPPSCCHGASKALGRTEASRLLPTELHKHCSQDMADRCITDKVRSMVQTAV